MLPTLPGFCFGLVCRPLSRRCGDDPAIPGEDDGVRACEPRDGRCVEGLQVAQRHGRGQAVRLGRLTFIGGCGLKCDDALV